MEKSILKTLLCAALLSVMLFAVGCGGQPGESAPVTAGVTQPTVTPEISAGTYTPGTPETETAGVNTPTATVPVNTPTVPVNTPTAPAITDFRPVPDSYQETNGNMRNGGYAAELNGKIYYSEQDDQNRLYRMDADGSNKEKLSDSANYSRYIYIQCANDTVYYMHSDGENEDVQYSIVSYNPQTGKETVITDDNVLYYAVYNDRIFYNTFDYDTEMGYLYRINADGTEKTELLESRTPDSMQIKDGMLYLSFYESLYIMNISGGDDCEYRYYHYSLQPYNDSIYFVDYDMQLYKGDIGKDSDDVAVIMTDVFFFNISDNRLLYVNGEEKIYIANLDGSNSRLIAEGGLPIVIGDWVYYISKDLTMEKVSIK
ncbi:MAG: DUF5050 domain-containing protein [Firmicutes bacterium]|nr:DUF5050 domain-containing protein [Bacillota bacterium]